MASIQHEYQLQMNLYEAKLQKAQIEKAEVSADFQQERLKLHKKLLESKEENEKILLRELSMKDELDTFKDLYKELEKNTGDTGNNLGHFRKQMEKLTKKMQVLEIDLQDWKRKYESSNEQVIKMNANGLEREQEIEKLKKKVGTMENLNRALHKERTELLHKVRAIENSEN